MTPDTPTLAEMFESAGYGRFDGADIDEAVRWLLAERHLLNDQVRKLRLVAYFGDMEMQIAAALDRRIARLRKAALRYRRQRDRHAITADSALRYRSEELDDMERQRDAHAEREALAQKQLLEAERLKCLADGHATRMTESVRALEFLLEHQKKIVEEREALLGQKWSQVQALNAVIASLEKRLKEATNG